MTVHVPTQTETTNALASARLALSLAQSQQATLLQASNNFDSKAVGLAGFDASLIAALIAVQTLFEHWWAATIPLSLSALCCVWCLVGRQYDLGPQPDAFYKQYGGGSEPETTVYMLGAMSTTLTHNDATLSHKGRWFQGGVAVLLVALLVGLITLRP